MITDAFLALTLFLGRLEIFFLAVMASSRKGSTSLLLAIAVEVPLLCSL